MTEVDKENKGNNKKYNIKNGEEKENWDPDMETTDMLLDPGYIQVTNNENISNSDDEAINDQ